MLKTIDTLLHDNWTGDPQKIPCTIECDNNSILIRPQGYGDASSKDGCGWPIVVEYYQKEIRVLVWGNINNGDPTHIISLTGAEESKRAAE